MPKKTPADTPLHRSCGAMAAHMMLLEKYPSFRASQMRLEGTTHRRRELGLEAAKIDIVTVKTVVHVVYNTPEQNVSNAQIKSQMAVLNRDFRATNPDRSQTPLPLSPVNAKSRRHHTDVCGFLVIGLVD